MPLSYGGGVHSLEQIQRLFAIGYEKVILNTALVETPDLIREAVAYAGSRDVGVFGHGTASELARLRARARDLARRREGR